jgi:hypothetical protein
VYAEFVLTTAKPLVDLSQRALRTLPQLVGYALDHRSASSKFFRRMFRIFENANLIYPSNEGSNTDVYLRITVWDHVDVPICAENHTKPDAVALVRLLQELTSVRTQSYDWRQWIGGEHDRLSFILLLYRFLYLDRVFNVATFDAVLPWAMTLSRREWQITSSTSFINCPEAEEESRQERRLREFISRQILQHSPQAIEAFCTGVISHGSFSIPPPLLLDLGSAVQELLGGKPEVALSASRSMDKLFLHFLTKRSSDTTHSSDDQHRTLVGIVAIISDASRAGMNNWKVITSKKLLKKWRSLLLRSKAYEERWEVDMQAQPDETRSHYSNEAGTPTERNLAAEDSFSVSPAVSVSAILQLVEAALNSSADSENGVEPVPD